MHRGVAQDAALGQEGGVEHQQERQDAEVDCGEQGCRLLPVAVDEQQVGRRHEDHPGDQGGVLHRIPCPKPTKAERFIRPRPAHQDACAQNSHGKEGPGQDGLDPRSQVATPKRAHGVSERHAARGKPQKQGWRVDGHPIILQEGIQPLAIGKLRDGRQVVGPRCPRQANVVGGFAQQQEGVEAQLEIPEVDAQKHDPQKRLDAAEHSHHLPLPVVGPSQDEQRKHIVPKHPQQKPALLAAPKGAEHEAHGHVVVEVFPDVLELIAVPKKEHENQRDDPQGAACMGQVGTSSEVEVSFPKRPGCHQSRHKCERHQEPAGVRHPNPFPQVFHQASASTKWFCSLYFEGHFISISVARKCVPLALP